MTKITAQRIGDSVLLEINGTDILLGRDIAYRLGIGLAKVAREDDDVLEDPLTALKAAH